MAEADDALTCRLRINKPNGDEVVLSLPLGTTLCDAARAAANEFSTSPDSASAVVLVFGNELPDQQRSLADCDGSVDAELLCTLVAFEAEAPLPAPSHLSEYRVFLDLHQAEFALWDCHCCWWDEGASPEVERRLAAAQERLAAAQERLAAAQERLAGLEQAQAQPEQDGHVAELRDRVVEMLARLATGREELVQRAARRQDMARMMADFAAYRLELDRQQQREAMAELRMAELRRAAVEAAGKESQRREKQRVKASTRQGRRQTRQRRCRW